MVEPGDPLKDSHTAPKFAAPDPGASAEWYRDYLGFPNVATYLDGDYAIIKRGDLCIHFWKCEERKISENTSCYTEISGLKALNALHAEFIQASKRDGFAPGRIEAKPKDQIGHGMREFHVWDPAGNLIGFGAALNR